MLINCKGEHNNFTVGKPGRHHLSQVIRVKITTQRIDIHTEKGTTSLTWCSCQNAPAEETTSNPKLRHVLQNNCLVLFKSVKVMNK